MDEALANGSLMEPKEVADAVLFMLTRPRNVVIRDLVILPNSVGPLRQRPWPTISSASTSGPGSARAGVFDPTGTLLASAKTEIRTLAGGRRHRRAVERGHLARVCRSVREALCSVLASTPISVAGIGFDATCSLVVLGGDGQPLAVGPSGDAERNIIVWMDHRATDQARRINTGDANVLRYVGGTISPEMETPKLLWLAEKLPQTFAAAWQFFDLTDFLTWRCTGSLARSICTVTCKWTYLAHEQRWDEDYFRAIGLGRLADENFARIGTEIVAGGTPLGSRPDARSRRGTGPGAGNAGRSRPDRRTCRRRRHRWGARWTRHGVDADGLCIRHLGLHHDDDASVRLSCRASGAPISRPWSRDSG